MPEQRKKASFAGKLGAGGAQAAAKAAKKPVNYGQRSLPPGITNGVARLKEVQLTELDDKTGYKQLDGSSAKGELLMTLIATAETPETVQDNGSTVKVKGIEFRKFCPIFRKGARGDFGAEWDLQQCVDEAANELRKIAGQDFDTSDVDAAIAALNAASPKLPFHFTTVMGKASTKIDPKTGKPYPPRLNVYWNGSEGLSAEEPDPGAEVQDDTGGDADAAPFTGDIDGQEGGDEAADYDWENMTLAELGELADSDPDPADGTPAHEAQARLSEMVRQKGYDEGWLQQHDNWVAIAADLEEPEPEPEPAPPPKKPGLKPGGAKPAPAKPAPAKKPTPGKKK